VYGGKPEALAQIAEIHAWGKTTTPIIARLGAGIAGVRLTLILAIGLASAFRRARAQKTSRGVFSRKDPPRKRGGRFVLPGLCRLPYSGEMKRQVGEFTQMLNFRHRGSRAEYSGKARFLRGYCALEDSVGYGCVIADIGCSGLQKVRRVARCVQTRN
jgi:hypothetical protein